VSALRDAQGPADRHAGAGRDHDGHIDLHSYAAIGDGRTVALIAEDGRIDWLPLPDLDSVPLSPRCWTPSTADTSPSARTGPGGYEVERQYVEATNVLATVTDALNTGIAGRLRWAELARRIEGLSGCVRLRATICPGTCVNTSSPWVQQTVHSGPAPGRADNGGTHPERACGARG
jgi:hypothetical protein